MVLCSSAIPMRGGQSAWRTNSFFCLHRCRRNFALGDQSNDMTNAKALTLWNCGVSCSTFDVVMQGPRHNQNTQPNQERRSNQNPSHQNGAHHNTIISANKLPNTAHLPHSNRTSSPNSTSRLTAQSFSSDINRPKLGFQKGKRHDGDRTCTLHSSVPFRFIAEWDVMSTRTARIAPVLTRWTCPNVNKMPHSISLAKHPHAS